MSERSYVRSNPLSWPLAAIGAALCLMIVSGLIDLERSNSALDNVAKQQVAAIAQTRKAEDQLNALAKGVQQLADGGDVNAQSIVAKLQRSGIHINPNAAR